MGGKITEKNEKGNKLLQFSILGTYSAGLNGKKESLYKIINKFRPSAITIQESKLSRPGLIKIPGYQIFPTARLQSKGTWAGCHYS
jgi:hypothetical protein